MEINKIYLPLLANQDRYLVLFGGAGSGKSYFACQKLLLRLTTEQGHRIMVIRKVQATIKSSVWNLLLKLISDYNLTSEFTILNNDFKIKHNKTANEFVFFGCDDVEKLKSVDGITSIWIEEATELERTDLLQLDLRLRGETKNYKQIIICFNPINEDHWLKPEFFDSKVDNCTIVKSTYKDNALIDLEYKTVIEKRMKNDENYYRIYGLGEWGRESSEGCFYKSFRHSRHVCELEYQPELPLHVSLDFNVNPGCSITVWQAIGKKLFLIDEIQLPYPKNHTADVCRELRYKYDNHKAGLYVYGDSTGKKDDTTREKGFNNYSIVQQELAQFRPIMRVALKNPSVAMRCNFINALLDGEMQDITIKINTTCKKTIQDLSYLKQDADGTKYKEMTTDDKTKIKYQKYGHFSDTIDYFVCEFLKTDFHYYMRGGKKDFQSTYGKNPINTKYSF